MPYIKQGGRSEIDRRARMAATSGELNYAITKLCKYWFQYHGEDYQAINDVLGALEGAKLEFYRRVAVPFEEKKIKENGDVY